MANMWEHAAVRFEKGLETNGETSEHNPAPAIKSLRWGGEKRRLAGSVSEIFLGTKEISCCK
jgi:hypothetical protein